MAIDHVVVVEVRVRTVQSIVKVGPALIHLILPNQEAVRLIQYVPIAGHDQEAIVYRKFKTLPLDHEAHQLLTMTTCKECRLILKLKHWSRCQDYRPAQLTDQTVGPEDRAAFLDVLVVDLYNLVVALDIPDAVLDNLLVDLKDHVVSQEIQEAFQDNHTVARNALVVDREYHQHSL